MVVAAIKLGNRAGRVFEPGEDFLIVDDLAVERELCQAGCRCLELGDVVEDDEARLSQAPREDFALGARASGNDDDHPR